MGVLPTISNWHDGSTYRVRVRTVSPRTSLTGTVARTSPSIGSAAVARISPGSGSSAARQKTLTEVSTLSARHGSPD